MAIPPDQSQADAGQTPAAPPVCFRHPGRQTYVSCVRCGRPACPDCLRPAAVGHQCVECIRSGNRGVRSAQGRFGGQVTTDAKVTWALVSLNVICYIAELAYPNFINDGEMLGKFATQYGVANGEWYRLITSAFLHYPPGSGLGLFHILFNMWALIVVGPSLERVLGRVRFLAVYLVSALGGSVLYYLIAPPGAPAIGASGAIFGLFGAYFVMARRMRANTNQIVGLIVLNLVIGFVVANIGWQAHVGGLIAGSALTAAYAYAPKQNRAALQAAATVAIVALLVVGVVIRDHQLANVVVLR
jgi:membrane associated rhomboid family serine protease